MLFGLTSHETIILNLKEEKVQFFELKYAEIKAKSMGLLLVK